MATYASLMGGRENFSLLKKAKEDREKMVSTSYHMKEKEDREKQATGLEKQATGLKTGLNMPGNLMMVDGKLLDSRTRSDPWTGDRFKPESEKKPSLRYANKFKTDYQKSELDREFAGLPAPVAAPARRIDLDEDGDGGGGMMNFERELRRRRKKTRTKFAGETEGGAVGGGGYGGTTQLG